MEHDFLWETLPRTFHCITLKPTRFEEIDRKLNHKFYNEYNGKSAPRWFRHHLNRRFRYKTKRTIYKAINTAKDYIFEDNYKDAYWRFW